MLYDSVFPTHLISDRRLHTVSAIPFDSAEPSFVSQAVIEKHAADAAADKSDLVLDCEQLSVPSPYSYLDTEAKPGFYMDPRVRKILNTTRIVAGYASRACASRGIKWGFYGLGIPAFVMNNVRLGDSFGCTCGYHSHANESDDGWEKMVQSNFDYVRSTGRPCIVYVNPVYIWGDPAYYGTPVEEKLWDKSLKTLKHLGVDVGLWGVTSATDPTWGFDPAGANMQALVKMFGKDAAK